MVDDVDDACQVFAHVCFHIVGLCEKLCRAVIQVGGDDLVRPAFLVVFIEFVQTVCEKTVGGADEYTACLALLQLAGNIQHTLAGGNHIIDDDHILAFHGGAQKFVGNNGILAVDNGGIVAAFVEHAHVHAEDIGKIYGSGHCAFIRTDDHQMIVVQFEVRNILYQRFQKLVGGKEVVKDRSAERSSALWGHERQR